jgi:hypothetical protein
MVTWYRFRSSIFILAYYKEGFWMSSLTKRILV